MLPGTPTSSRGVDDRDARARIEKTVLAPRPLGRLPAVGDPVDDGPVEARVAPQPKRMVTRGC
jgi:hypothetical protein